MNKSTFGTADYALATNNLNGSFLLLSPSRKAAEQEHEQIAEHHARADRRGEEVRGDQPRAEAHHAQRARAHDHRAEALEDAHGGERGEDDEA
jgi:hypothetical protein